jgi:hypothetical protein
VPLDIIRPYHFQLHHSGVTFLQDEKWRQELQLVDYTSDPAVPEPTQLGLLERKTGDVEKTSTMMNQAVLGCSDSSVVAREHRGKLSGLGQSKEVQWLIPDDWVPT